MKSAMGATPSKFILLPRELLVQLLQDRKRRIVRILSRSNSLEIPDTLQVRRIKEEVKALQSVLCYDESLTI
jgi:hypothetical protein